MYCAPKKLSQASIPFLFLISVFVDNVWEVESEEKILNFLVSQLMGEGGLQSTTLEQFLNAVKDAELSCATVELNSFLMEQVRVS
jgi:hypothetical protein